MRVRDVECSTLESIRGLGDLAYEGIYGVLYDVVVHEEQDTLVWKPYRKEVFSIRSFFQALHVDASSLCFKEHGEARSLQRSSFLHGLQHMRTFFLLIALERGANF